MNTTVNIVSDSEFDACLQRINDSKADMLTACLYSLHYAGFAGGDEKRAGNPAPATRLLQKLTPAVAKQWVEYFEFVAYGGKHNVLLSKAGNWSGRSLLSDQDLVSNCPKSGKFWLYKVDKEKKAKNWSQAAKTAAKDLMREGKSEDFMLSFTAAIEQEYGKLLAAKQEADAADRQRVAAIVDSETTVIKQEHNEAMNNLKKQHEEELAKIRAEHEALLAEHADNAGNK